MKKRQTIAVLFGGQSGEHEVSLVSAHAVMKALDPEKYDVLPIGIRKDGRWLSGPGVLAALVAEANPIMLPTSFTNAQASEVTPGPVAHLTSMIPDSGMPSVARLLPPGIDVVFPVLHGPKGEDGTIQGLLELAALPYVGCGVAASAVGMDKALMKAAFAAADLPLLPWLLVRRRDFECAPSEVCERIEAALHYPVFVKPANMGSSVGVSKATNRASLRAALAEAGRYDRRIVVEQGIAAREIEVSILGNEDPLASTPGEIVPSGEWYDYEAKYIDDASKTYIPAPIDHAQTARVQELAIKAFQALDGAGLARVDFLLDKQSGALWLNEVNTMPGFTPISMYAKMWSADGLAYATLLDRLIELALSRTKE
ncbi:D-alanine--D-alanine ligase [Candidatus Chloroploca sp. M-50]|uniref:D-alanine--D-alanine ligase n=1 Tax=Candidatus Chloroploca mongolica TaxID=2528176 RepID=A0ABS4D578_9CHLR|nr:D-alanine--D-alanine ligase family protein [Candidatus Chloroploca mongolica]MBP1464574.1 D-alanine--D-alanine ligase [Candidatus Chloroploca mongolica]